MNKLFHELELKLSNFETGIENKINYVNNSCNNQLALLKDNFDIQHLTEKYSKELNDERERLLKRLSTTSSLEINRVNEKVKTNGKNTNAKILLDKINKTRTLIFKPSSIKSEKACIRKLVIKEYKLGKIFSPARLIRYKQILELSDLLKIKQGGELDLDKSFLSALENSKPNIEILRLFLDSGGDVNAQDVYAKTALINASYNGCLQTVKLLLDNEANNINSKDVHRNSALMFASSFGHFGIVGLLLENGADANDQDKNGKTALIKASTNGHLDIVEYLIDNGADIKTRDNIGNTALLSAAYESQFEVVKCLKEKGADVCEKDKDGNTAIMHAAIYGHLDLIKYLLDEGVDVNVRNIYGETALSKASNYEHLDIVKLFLEYGAGKS